MRKVEAVELVACDVFNLAEQTRQRVTFGDVERHPAMLASHHHGCTCGRCVLVPRVSAQRVYAIASGWQREVRATRVRGDCAEAIAVTVERRSTSIDELAGRSTMSAHPLTPRRS